MAGQGHTLGVSRFAEVGGGRRLHYMTRGSGGVTVVFESGMGFSRSCWGLVVPEVATRARTVVYDRAGLGRSDDDTAPRTLARLAADLAALLDALGPGPFVLVGHSWGGLVVRTVAAARPARIRGLVLVDPTDENCPLYFTPAAERRFAKGGRTTVLLARIGLYRLLGALSPGKAQPADVAADHRAEDFTVRAARGLRDEGTGGLADLRAVREAPPALGGLDLSVISGTKEPRADRANRAALTEAHRLTAAAHRNGRLVESPVSGHMVMFTDPATVAAEILRTAAR
ncbi:pimeloyl-ACP methyl ester carboxylesterase [Actinocorallia herbida]|uniref:Pimeloyl-ACP methyl ester carboxylesterase n=1 Tax=Actinocorallia herbida TaxID=58109 RepID=A0A3N1D508_9ACTN|nr:alpha/beta hydrolase [Actinocorallia herbida]ROO88607.1 pimeloyl-ACP methyl ester carboxylesterase [Actinocorallia herbida]